MMRPATFGPVHDGRQSPAAFNICRGAARLLRAHGLAAVSEVALANGRRADIAGVAESGEIWIVEIKSCLEDFRADQKWPEYRDFCDRFFFAIPQTLDPEIIPFEAGLIVADNWGAEILRQPAETLLHASRRKALTLAIARVSSQRLHSLYDP